MATRREPIAQRLFRHTRVGRPGECWPWTAMLKRGLPILSVGGLHKHARQLLAVQVGLVEPGAPAWMRCGLKACMNPSHLSDTAPPAPTTPCPECGTAVLAGSGFRLCSLECRLEYFTDRDAAGGHWKWWGQMTPGPHPLAVVRPIDNSTQVSVPRLYWIREHGELAKGRVVKRTCDEARCVRPLHFANVAAGAWLHPAETPCG